jgi:hypothetical protein
MKTTVTGTSMSLPARNRSYEVTRIEGRNERAFAIASAASSAARVASDEDLPRRWPTCGCGTAFQGPLGGVGVGGHGIDYWSAATLGRVDGNGSPSHVEDRVDAPNPRDFSTAYSAAVAGGVCRRQSPEVSTRSAAMRSLARILPS